MIRAFLIIGIFFSFSIRALPTVVPDPMPCVLELETHFFNESIVNQGLSLYNVRQELWVPIISSLQQRNLEVPARMKQRTAYMVPNPIEYPMQKAVTAEILKKVLFEVFIESMREYQAIDRSNAELIFNYIFNEQFSRFINCFGPEAIKLKPDFD